MTKGRKRLLTGAIGGFWLVMMLLLVRSEMLGSFLRGDVVLDRVGWVDETVESWLTLHSPEPDAETARNPSFGPRVGYAHLVQAPKTKHNLEGAELLLEVELVLQMLGRRTGLQLEGTAWRARTQRRADVDFSIRSGTADFRLVGTIIDDDLRATIESGGETSEFNAKLSDNALFTTGFGMALAFPPMELGEQIVIPSFDPMTLRATRSVVKAVSKGDLLFADGETVPSTRLEVRSSGLRTFAWIDEQGQVLQATTPIGLSLRRSTKEEALAPLDAIDNASELLQITAVKPSGLRPVRGAQVLEVTMPGVDGWDSLVDPDENQFSERDLGIEIDQGQTLAIPLDWRQKLLPNQTFRFSASSLAPPESGLADEVAAIDSEGLSELRESYLGSDAFIQSGHPKIKQQANAILQSVAVEGLPPWERQLRHALALHDWVYERLEKTPVLSLPSALEVLDSRKGDCNEHTILYTALARAADLPTRVAIGLVWSDVFDGFYYHAWPEVFLSGGEHKSQPVGYWIALDPTLGQPMADATHIKLLEGSIDRWPQLLPFLGQLEIEVRNMVPLNAKSQENPEPISSSFN